MINAILIIMLAIACYSVGFLVGRKNQKVYLEPTPKPEAPKPVLGKDECQHKSNKNLKVTSMGDVGEWFVCEKCGKKVPASKLTEYKE